MFTLDEPALLGSKRIVYKYACISQYSWHMKIEGTNILEKHLCSKIILKRVNDPLRVWKENQSIKSFQCYFHIKKRHGHILLVDDGKNDDGNVKVTEDI